MTDAEHLASQLSQSATKRHVELLPCRSADRLGVKPVLIAGLLVQALEAGTFVFAGRLEDFYAIAAVFGLAYGGVMPLYAVLARGYFGPHIIGTVIGAATMISCLGMAIGPLYYSLYDAVCVRLGSEFADTGTKLEETNRARLTPHEVEEMVRLLIEADGDTVFVRVLQMRFTTTARLSSGRPRQFSVMWQNIRCSIRFHLLVPGGK